MLLNVFLRVLGFVFIGVACCLLWPLAFLVIGGVLVWVGAERATNMRETGGGRELR